MKVVQGHTAFKGQIQNQLTWLQSPSSLPLHCCGDSRSLLHIQHSTPEPLFSTSIREQLYHCPKLLWDSSLVMRNGHRTNQKQFASSHVTKETMRRLMYFGIYDLKVFLY